MTQVSILPQLERDLHEAARQRLPEERPRRPWRRRRAGLATLAGVAVALAVVVVALSLRGAQQPTAASPPLAPPSYLGLHQLLSRFAVLSRPQTAAERGFRPYPVISFLPRFTRLATTLPDGERVFLTVSRVRDRFSGQPVGSYMLSIWLVGASGKVNVFSGGPSYNHLWGYMRFPVLLGSNPHRSWVWVGIVPDGVTSVAWEFRPRTLVEPVRGNVAAALLPGSAGTVIDKVLWYRAHQQVARFQAPIKYVLHGNGIAGATLGEPEIEVVSLLSHLLGHPPRGQLVPSYVCGGADVAIYWQNLTTFFKDDRFVAYSYWEQQVVPTWWPLLATARGLTIGETPAYAGRLYGPAFRTSTGLGGTWFLATPRGTLDGFTYGASFGPRNTITTIQAGPHICETFEPSGLPRHG